VSVTVVNFRKLAQAEEKRKATAGKQEPEKVEIHSPLTVPEPVEPGVEQPALAAPQQDGGGPLIPSPNPSSSFMAQFDEVKVGTNTRSIPPDTTGAVGTDRVFSTLNSNYRIQNKADGATLSTMSINTFWAGLNNNPPAPPVQIVSGVFDPRIQYDPYNSRWILAAVSNSRSLSASVLVGVSQTSDPLGNYHLFRFVVGCAFNPSDPPACNSNGEWADFPMLGFNKNWVAVGWNQFHSGDPGAQVAGKIVVLDYPSMRAGASNAQIFTHTGSGSFCMHPATTLSATEETLYVPVHLSSSGASYRLHRVTGTSGAPILTLDSAPSRIRPGGGWIQPGGDTLPQTCVGPAGTCPATVRPIESQDAFLRSNVVFRNGSIWYAQTIGLPATQGGPLARTAAQWTRIDTNGSFVDGGRVDDPAANATSGEWYAYASIGVNANNDVLLGFSSFSGTHFARAGYTFRAGTDTAGTMRDPVIFKEGEDYYSKSFSQPDPEQGRNRWGDFSNTVVDPSNDLDLWTIQEYAGMRTVADGLRTTNASRWSTWWARVADVGSPPPLPTPTPSPTPTPTPTPPPPNDMFVNARVIGGCVGNVTGTNAGATKEAGEPVHVPASPGSTKSVWYRWQAPNNASVTIDTVGSDFDTLLAVYTGNSVNALTLVKNNDDIVSGINVASTVTFDATQGTVYRIAVDGFDNASSGGDTGNITLNWNLSNCPPPTILLEDGSNRVAAVDSVTFVRGPFTVVNRLNFSGDQRTRVIFFTSSLGLSQPDPAILSVQAAGMTLPVENVGQLVSVSGLDASYVVVKLPDGLPAGDWPLTVTLRGVNSSNTPILSIVASPSSPLNSFDALWLWRW
jgi:hypothetical protein